MSKKKVTSKPGAGVDGNTELTPGQILRRAREKQEMDIPYAAAELRLTENYVRALEEDHYEVLPATTFVIGYLKSYAKLLSVSSDEVVRSFRVMTASDENPRVAEQEPNRPSGFGPKDLRLLLEQHKKTLIAGLVAIAVVAILTLLGFWMARDSESGAPDAVNSQAATVSAGSPVSDAVADALNGDDAQPGSETNSTGGRDNGPDTSAIVPDSDSQPLPEPSEPVSMALEAMPAADDGNEASGEHSLIETEPTVAADSSPGASESSDRLSIHFTDDCWLEVVDGRDKTLTKNLYRRGDRIALEGEAPFDVLFGNALVANVQLNGQSVTLEPASGRKSLRTRIGESQLQQ